MCVIKECRRRIGTTPRAFPAEVERAVRVSYPQVLFATLPWDALARVYFDQAKLRERGEVVWAQIIQANNFLFNPGLNFEAHAATVLHAGPSLDDPSPLREMAERMESVREGGKKSPDSRALADLFHPSNRKFWAPVPASITDGREVYCSDLMIFRKLLPPEPKGATLQKLVFPLFVARDETRVVMQVPSRFWPPAFLEFWESA